MGSLKLQSFEDFSNAAAKAAALKLEEEQSAARNQAADQFKTLLAEFGVTSIKDLNEEDRNSFYRKLGASEITESVAVIEEGTRSQIGIINKRGKIESVYMHYDGYPDHMLPTIKKGYMNPGAVKFLLKKGGGSGLDADPSKINFYGDKTTMKGDMKDVDKYLYDAADRAGAEYVYLYDEKSKKWMMADTYDMPRELKPAFEHLVINEKFVPSKGNVKDAKKVAKTLEGIMMEGSALTGDETTHLGAIKYLLMNALEDANFHSYIEPVGKALGGKIRTVMIKVENLGGMELPVGAKSIKRFLDDNYVKLSSAAGWSGIGIVEGIALYLDGWGLSKHAQKIVDAFNLIYQNEAVVTEGNAFFAARAKAMEEGADEFEFNGKKFPLTKEEEEVEEGNAFGAARAEAIAKGESKFKVGDEEYDVEGVDADDKENAKEYAEEEGIEVEEGNAFGAARAEAIAKGESKFKVGDEEYDVEGVDADDKENAKEYAEEEGIEVKEEEVTEDEIEIKVDGDYEIEVEKEEDEEEGEEEAPAEEEGEEEEVAEEGVTNEAEVKSDEDFKEYAFAVLGKAFGDKFDEEKAQEVVDGLLDKHGDDYGAAVGALQSSLG